MKAFAITCLVALYTTAAGQETPTASPEVTSSSQECVANITKLLEYFKEEFPKQVPDVIDVKGTGRKPGKSALLLIGFKETQLITPEKLECSNQTTVSFLVPIEGRAAIYLGAAVRPEVWRSYFKSTVKLAGTFNLLKGPSLDKIEVQKIAFDKLQLLEAGAKDTEQPAQQFVARVCASLLKTALAKEIPAITQRAVQKSLADLQQTFINSSVAALEKRGIQIYKLLESMLKTNKDGTKKDDRPITTQDLLTRRRNSH